MPDVDSTTLMELMESDDWKGYRDTHRSIAVSARQVDSFVGMMENRDGLDRYRRAHEIREAMTTSDFPTLFGNVINRDLLSHYRAVQPNMERILRKRTGILDLKRAVETYIKGGLTTMRMQQVKEKGEYLASKTAVDRTTYLLNKYGKQLDFSWEAFLADDLGLFSQFGQDLATSSVNTRQHHITSQFFTAAGPIAAAFGNAAASTLPLTINNLIVARAAMAAFRHPDTNEPIMNVPVFIVVDPALEGTLDVILNSTQQIWISDHAAAAAVGTAFPLGTTNVAARMGLTKIVNPWQSFVDTTSGTTAWALFSDPNQIAVGEFATLSGHETPQIVMKAPDTVSIGGSPSTPFSGDFKTDNIFYRIRDIFRAKTVEPRAAWASDGTG